MPAAASQSIIRDNIVLASAVGLSWIIVGHFYRHPGDLDPEPVRWALSALGIWFLACGLWAYVRVQTALAELFLLYCALSAVHWGGPIGVGSRDAQSIELAFYIIFGSLAPQAAFLDLARRLRFVADDRMPALWWAPYLPAIAGVALFVVYLAEPDNKSLLSAFSWFYATGILLSLVGGAILVARPFVGAENRRANALLAGAVASGWVPHAFVAGGLVDAEGYDGLYNLPLAMGPLALAWYITALARRP